MKQWKRLFYYLLLNVLVSACTITAVLLFWERTHPSLPGGLTVSQAFGFLHRATATPTQAPLDQPTPGPTPTEEYIVYQVISGDTFESIAEAYNMSPEELIQINGFTQSQPIGEGEILRIPARPKGSVVIDTVIGAGDLNSEAIILKHRGEGELPLAGWKLEDEQGNVYTFPQLVLFRNGAVSVYTMAGTDTVVDLYWGLQEAVWGSGEKVTLRDAQGQVRNTYLIP